jgi:hypothetical protein
MMASSSDSETTSRRHLNLCTTSNFYGLCIYMVANAFKLQ